MRHALIIVICSCSHFAWSQDNEQNEVGKTIDKFLKFLSFSDSASLLIDSLSTVFTHDGKLTANFGKVPVTFTVAQFTERIRSDVRSGKQFSSNERELARKVDVFGKIAHVLSTYELIMVGKEGKVIRRGINSIQLIKHEGQWLILSLIWDRENDSLKLPPKYLSN